MSKTFAESFFPHVCNFASSDAAPSIVLNAWNFLFPEETATLCGLDPPGPHYIHRPCLAAAACVGAYMGVARGSKNRMRGREMSRRYALLGAILDNWSRASWEFGLMNIAALLHHCILPPSALSNSFVDDSFWALDCIFTGASSINIVVVALLICIAVHKERPELDGTSPEDMLATIRGGMYFSILPKVVAATFSWLAWKNGFRTAIGALVELFYIVPVSIAASMLFPILLDERAVPGARLAIFGGATAVASLPLDAKLCAVVSEHAPSVKSSPLFKDVYHAPTLLFLGCDVAFLGLDSWVAGMVDRLHRIHHGGGRGRKGAQRRE